MTVKAIVHPEESGGYWAEVPALPGCFTEGDTIEELETNIREAVEAWLLAGEPLEANQDQVLEVAV